ACAVLATAAHAQAPDATPQAAPPAVEAAAAPATRPAEVRVGDTVVFSLRAEYAGRSAALRARAANDALHDVLGTRDEEVRIEHVGGAAAIYVGTHPVVQ